MQTVRQGHEHSLTVTAVPTRPFEQLRPASNPLLRQLVADADVVHLHGVWDALPTAVARACRTQDKPYLIAPHGMLDPWSLQQRRWKKRLALALFARRMLRGAAAVHVLNEHEAQFVRVLLPQAPTVTVPNGVDLSQIDTSLHAEAVPTLPCRGPFVLFMSRLHFKKGLDILAEAFALVAAQRPDVHLVVMGPESGAGDDLRRRIASHDLTDRVHVVGPEYGKAKYQALQQACCFVLPSRQEGFSVAILEALACRTPVVISAACHFDEVAEQGAGLIVDNLEPPAFADALLRLCGDAASGRRMGDIGRSMVERSYTWPSIAAELEAVYQRIVSAAPKEKR